MGYCEGCVLENKSCKFSLKRENSCYCKDVIRFIDNRDNIIKIRLCFKLMLIKSIYI